MLSIASGSELQKDLLGPLMGEADGLRAQEPVSP